MKSIVIATHPLMACLGKAEEIAGGLSMPWASAKPDGQKFIKFCVPDITQCGLISEMETRASRDHTEVNAWLKSRGFNIEMPPGGDLYLASILDLLVKWLYRGIDSPVSGGFKGVKLDARTAEVIYEERWPRHQYAVKIGTQGGDTAYMFLPHTVPKTEWEVIEMIGEVSNMLKSRNSRIGVSRSYEGVIFPQVQIDTQPDVSWMEDMSAGGNDGKPLLVAYCKEQVKLRLDLEGASVKAAAAMVVTRGIGPTPFVIDKPFLFWIERRGVTDPLVWAYLAEDAWVKNTR
jgi:hypothetical protein